MGRFDKRMSVCRYEGVSGWLVGAKTRLLDMSQHTYR